MSNTPKRSKITKNSPSSPRNWSVIVTIFCLFLFCLFIPTTAHKSQPYSEFINQVESDRVAQVTIGTNRISYTLKPELVVNTPQEIFTTVIVEQDTNLPQLLHRHQVEFSATPSAKGEGVWGLIKFLFFFLLIISLSNLIFNRSRSGDTSPFTIGRSNPRIYSEGTVNITFDDVAGIDEAKAEIYEIVDFLQHQLKYSLLGAKIPKGILLVGPPGTGKTLLAKAIAGEAKVPFFSISGSEFIEMFVGVGASRVRDLFDRAKQEAPAIIFIDELDALGKSRAAAGALMGGNDEREQTLNQLLAEMDGFEPNAGVILLAATNRPEVLDPALLRPGRFDRRIVVDRPDKSGRLAILEVHARDVCLGQDVDLDLLAARTPGFAGADLANLINEAALLAARYDRSAVLMADFNEATERILTGLAKKSRVLNEIEKKTVAYHEIGHGIVASLMPGTDKIEKISIVPRSIGALGYTLQLPEEDRFLMIEDEIRGRIATLLGGRAAEELILGKVSTGAADDIQKATDLAQRYVTIYGMSDRIGPIALEEVQHQFLDGVTNPRRQVSPNVATEIDCEVKAIIDGAHQIATEILQVNRELLINLAQILLHQEVLEGSQLRSQLSLAQTTLTVDRWLQTGKLTRDKFLAPVINNNGKTKVN
ncbi:MAG: ATP-dependent zinc metalloprotease FtsH [Cyanobacteria bacterium P01_A01_bin.83]